MRKRWANLLTALTFSLGISSAWAQVPVPQPAVPPTLPGIPQQAPVPMTEPGGRGDISQSTAPPSASAPHESPSVVIPNSCDTGCGRKCTWSITGGLYYLKPVWSSGPNTAFSTTTTTATTSTTNTQNFDYNIDLGFSGAIGFTMASGGGMRVGAFRFDTDTTVAGTLAAGSTLTAPNGFGAAFPAASTVTATNELKISLFDVEATYATTSAGWNTIWGAGLRYVNLKQSYGLSAFDGAGVASATISSTNNFEGIGPTISVESHKQCGCTNFGVYGIARGSVVFGDRDESATTTATGLGALSVSSSARDVLPIGEIELGGEWGKNFSRCRVFGQVGVVGQAWIGAGNAAPVSTGSSASNSNMGLYGGVFRLGVSF